MNMKKALITGIPVQGGSYIIEKYFIILVSNNLQR
jgi:GDP-D-mannose dehydratase